MSKIHETLQLLGLSAKEVDTYLLLLSTGAAPASVIGKRAGIPKSTARYVCLELAKKGLVTFSRKDDTFLYVPEPPERIVHQLEKQKQKIEHQQESALRVMGQLKAMMNPQSAHPKVRFYEGANGIAEAFMSMLAGTPAEILSYVRPLETEDVERLLPSADGLDVAAAVKRFIDERIRQNIPTRVIALRTSVAEELHSRDAEELRQTRIVDDLPHDGSPVEILLSQEKICFVIAHSGLLFASVVQNEGIASLHRAMFELAWDAAKHYQA